MKTKSDPRHQNRVATVKELFAWHFKQETETGLLAKKVLEQLKEIDKIVGKNAPAWPVTQIAPLDLAVLRLAVYELLFKDKKEPYKVVIDEAVEIAKEYGSETSGSFVNGVLGSVVKETKNIK